jgi:hypothetical protein
MLIRTNHEELFNLEAYYTGGMRGFGGAVHVFRLPHGTLIESRNAWALVPSLTPLVGDDTPFTQTEGDWQAAVKLIPLPMRHASREVLNPPTGMDALLWPHLLTGEDIRHLLPTPPPAPTYPCHCVQCHGSFQSERADDVLCGPCEYHFEMAHYGESDCEVEDCFRCKGEFPRCAYCPDPPVEEEYDEHLCQECGKTFYTLGEEADRCFGCQLRRTAV